jgi:hypothetical protein
MKDNKIGTACRTQKECHKCFENVIEDRKENRPNGKT